MPYNTVIDRATNEAIELPEQVARDVIQEAAEQSVALQLGQRVNMTAKSTRVPVLDVLPTAYFVNGDTGLKQTTSAEWDAVYLTAEPIAALVVVPDDFMQDATVPIWTEVKPRIAEAIGRVLDNAILWGIDKPASWGTHVYAHAASAGNFVEEAQGGSGKTDLFYDLAQQGLQLSQDGFNLTGFATEPGFNWKTLSQRQTDNGVIYVPQDVFGVPFVESRNGAWDNEVRTIAGDWRKLLVGVRQDITYTMHTDAVISDGSGNVVFNAMQQDSKIMRVVGRFGFAVANPVTALNSTKSARSPFSLLTQNNSVGS
jgi:HK97 family phage major capsid protein